MASFNGRVIDGGLNLRSTCSTSSSSPIQIPNGTSIVVEIVSGQHAWFATSYGGHDGYVVAEFVAISSDGGTQMEHVLEGTCPHRGPVQEV